MEDYAAAMLRDGKLTQAEYEALLAARARDFGEINRRLTAAKGTADERRLRAMRGETCVNEWQAELERWE